MRASLRMALRAGRLERGGEMTWGRSERVVERNPQIDRRESQGCAQTPGGELGALAHRCDARLVGPPYTVPVVGDAERDALILVAEVHRHAGRAVVHRGRKGLLHDPVRGGPLAIERFASWRP